MATLNPSYPSPPSGNPLVSNLIAAGAVGTLVVLINVSFGSVIFAGELAEYLPQGVGLMLFSALVVVATVAALGGYPATVATPQDSTVPVLALVAGNILQGLPDTAPVEVKYYTVIGMIMLNSVITGTLFIALGHFRLGELVRFIPYPVVAGFLAGIGALLIKSAFHSLNGLNPHHFQLFDLLQTNLVLQWLPALATAIVLFLAMQRFSQFWVLPGIIGTAIALFYLALQFSGTPISAAAARGLLLGDIPAGNLFRLETIPTLTQADWPLVGQQLPQLVALWLVDTIALLFSASGMELMLSRDLDLNRELQAAGVASLAAGLGAGVGGYHLLSETKLAHELGGRSRLVGWAVAGICLAMILGGAGLLDFFPKFVVVGVPLLLGIELLHEWLYDSWFKFSLPDFLLISLITLVIASIGYLEGIGVGLIAAVVLFVVDFSRVKVIKHELSGGSYHSQVRRSPQQSQFLDQNGDQIQLLELQGYIFFATANNLLTQVKQLVQQSQPRLKFLLLDFRQVTGLDSSAVLSFSKLMQFALQQELKIVFTHLKPQTQQLLQQGGVLSSPPEVCYCFPDRDHGVEWCETQLLESINWKRSRFIPLPMQLERLFSDPDAVTDFMPYLEKLQAKAGDVLFQSGDHPEGLFFLESGQVSTFSSTRSGDSLRLSTLTPGTVLGIIAFHRRRAYRVTAIADQASTLYRLSVDQLARMLEETPHTAAIFQQFMLNQMAERLAQANENIKDLLS